MSTKSRLDALEKRHPAQAPAPAPIVLSDADRWARVGALLSTYQARYERSGAEPESPPKGSDDWRAQQILAILNRADARRKRATE